MNPFDLKNYFKFTLPSGVSCEIKEMVGKHQRLLTQQKSNQTHNDRLNVMLADLIVSVGLNRAIDVEFVENMLTVDRKYALLMARQYAMDFEKVYTYVYTYEHNGQTYQYPVEVDLKEDGTFPFKPVKNQVNDYEMIQKEYEFTLPKSGALVKISPMTGKGEIMASKIKKKEASSHTLLKVRRLRYFAPDVGKEGMWLEVPYDKLGLKDLQAIRTKIKDIEGDVDTKLTFEHPLVEQGVYASNSPEAKVTVDVLNTVDFFFPSGSLS